MPEFKITLQDGSEYRVRSEREMSEQEALSIVAARNFESNASQKAQKEDTNVFAKIRDEFSAGLDLASRDNDSVPGRLVDFAIGLTSIGRLAQSVQDPEGIGESFAKRSEGLTRAIFSIPTGVGNEVGEEVERATGSPVAGSVANFGTQIAIPGTGIKLSFSLLKQHKLLKKSLGPLRDAIKKILVTKEGVPDLAGKFTKGGGAAEVGQPLTALKDPVVKGRPAIPTPERLLIEDLRPVAKTEDIGSAIDLSLVPVETPTFFNRDLGFMLRQIGQSTQSALRDFGKSGTTLSKLILGARDAAEREAGELTEVVKQLVKPLTKKESKNLVDILNKGADPTSARAFQVSKVMRSIFDRVGVRAEKSGLDILNPVTGQRVPFALRENFFPHIFPKGFDIAMKDPALKAKVVKSLMERYQKNEGEALQLLNILRKSSLKRFGNLEVARVMDAPGFITDPAKAIPLYLSSALKRISFAEALGGRNEKARKLIAGILFEAGENPSKLASELVNRVTGVEDLKGLSLGLGGGVGSGIRGIQAATKLGLAVIPNASQSTLTAIVAGAGNTSKALALSLTKEGKEFARVSGVLLDSTLGNIMAEIAGTGGNIASKTGRAVLTGTGFSAIERTNRVIAANSGRLMAREMFDKIIKNPTGRRTAGMKTEMAKMGVNLPEALARRALNLEDEIKAAQNLVNRTQFKIDPSELPILWSSPLGRVVTQFKSFSFNAARLIKDDVLKPAIKFGRTGGKEGTIMPLLRTAALTPFAGAAVLALQDLAAGRVREYESTIAFIADHVAAVGAFGIFYDFARSALFGEAGVLGTITGPTGGDIGEIISAGVKSVSEGEIDPILSELIKRIPVVGRRLERERRE